MRRSGPRFLWCPFLLAASMGLGAIGVWAEPENVLVFSGTGEFLKSYNIGDYTTGIDATQITYEEYDPGSPPAQSGGGTEPYTYSPGEFWIPNDLNGMYPDPVGGLPPVSLYSFDEAVLSFDMPGVPGVSVSPATGTYMHTVDVVIQAFPASGHIEIFNQNTLAWDVFGNSTHVILAQSRTLVVRAVDGGLMSPEKTLAYTIDQDPGVDTDQDGIPDLIEILLLRFDPLVSDSGKDTDGDGWKDIDEILRGSDPDSADSDGDGWSDADEVSMGSDPNDPSDSPVGPPPPYAPPLVPIDGDNDGWPDMDEAWRSTAAADNADFPTARRLYEVEMLADGLFNEVQLCPGCQRNLSVREHDGDTLFEETIAADSFSNLRTPRGAPSILRLAVQSVGFVEGATQVNNTWTSRRLLESIDDPSSADIPSASWYNEAPTDLVANWLAAWEALLANTLLQPVVGLEVNPEDAAPVAMFERIYSYLGGLTASEAKILGRKGNSPNAAVVEKLGERLANPVQVPPSATPVPKLGHELAHTLQQTAEMIGADLAVIDCYSSYTEGQDLERTIAEKIAGATYSYPAVLAMSLSYDEMLASGEALADLLNWKKDLEPDGLPNFVEALGFLNGVETNIFLEDTDGDGVADPFDNCSTSGNPGGADNDSDGIGDACDPDDDNDGLEDTLEGFLGTDPFNPDSDGDGIGDGEESNLGLDPSDSGDAVFYHTHLNEGPGFAARSFPNTLSAIPNVLAGVTSFNGGIPAQPDLRNVSASGFEIRVEKDPAAPGAIVSEQVGFLAFDPAPLSWNGGTRSASEEWEFVPFTFPYPLGSVPHVFATLQSEFDTSTTLHAEVDGIASDGFMLRIRANSGSTPPASIDERVSWLAFLPGSEVPGGGTNGELIVGASLETVLFETPFETPPTLLAMPEGEGVHAILGGSLPAGFQILLQTDVSEGSPAPARRVSWVAFGTPVCEDPDHDGVCSSVDNAPDIYNPDQLDTDGDGFANIVEFLLGSDFCDPHSVPSETGAHALLELIEEGATAEELFLFAQMWEP